MFRPYPTLHTLSVADKSRWPGWLTHPFPHFYWLYVYRAHLNCGFVWVRYSYGSWFEIDSCWLSAKQAALRNKVKDELARVERHIYLWTYFSEVVLKSHFSILIDYKIYIIILSINLFSSWYNKCSWKLV
jgi:hypothetical protein